MEAQQNSDVKTTLLPIAIDTTRAMNVVFPDDKVSEVSQYVVRAHGARSLSWQDTLHVSVVCLTTSVHLLTRISPPPHSNQSTSPLTSVHIHTHICSMSPNTHTLPMHPIFPHSSTFLSLIPLSISPPPICFWCRGPPLPTSLTCKWRSRGCSRRRTGL